MPLHLPSLAAAIHTARPNAKPPKREKKVRTRIKVKAKPKAERDRITKVRQYVFARERHLCRCCRLRRAESLHEITPRARCGPISKTNSIAVCGQLGNGPECHGRLQRHQILVERSHSLGAEATLYFVPTDQSSRDWMKLGERHGMESPPMVDMEAAE